MKFVITSDCLEVGKHRAEGDVVKYTDPKTIAEMRSCGRIVEYGTKEAYEHIKRGKCLRKLRKNKDKNNDEKWHVKPIGVIIMFVITAIIGLALNELWKICFPPSNP